MTTITTKNSAPTLTLTLWKDEQPIGTCSLDEHGKLVVHASREEQQQKLQRLIRTKYRIQANFAREDQRPFDPERFLEGLPRYLHSRTISASYPTDVEADTTPDPPHLALPALDLETLPTVPRRRVRRP
jgi:hypothetical protein